MILTDKNKSILYALLIFIPTLFFGNEKYYLVLPLALLVLEYKIIISTFKSFDKKEFLYYVIFPLSFIILATVNKLVNGLKICSISDYYASFYLFFILIFSAYFIKHAKIFKYLLYLICIEIVFCFIEYLFNVRTFFIEIEISNIITNKNVLYDIHVYGLSVNSSVIALKILTGVMIVEFVKLPSYLKLILRAILMIGIILTFNRAVILSVFFFWFLLALKDLIKNGVSGHLAKKVLVTFFIFFIVFKFFSNESLYYQFTRGESTENVAISNPVIHKKRIKKLKEPCSIAKIEKIKDIGSFQKDGKFVHNGFLTSLFISNLPNINTSGRTLIWLNYFDFIDHHLLFGNGSDKYLIRNVISDTNEVTVMHAHNSYLEQLATHGLILTLFFFVILYLMWKKNNKIILITILFYSIFQYGIFWGYSYLDLLFMLFLISDNDFLTDGNT